MTDDQRQLLADFESKIRLLMSSYAKLKGEYKALKEESANKDNEIQAKNEEIERLNLRYETLKIARVVSVGQNEMTGAKMRLTKLVQDVDECIALLNE